MRFVVVGLALIGMGCARAVALPEASPPPMPIDTTPPVVVDTTPPPPPPRDTMISYRVPAFATEPLLRWGASPPGEARAERARAYDLQHQAVRVRFDWARRAVIGSTTIRLAALDSGLTAAAFDAVGMRIRGVRTPGGAPLEHRYDGRILTVVLKPRLAPRARTSVIVDYETERPRKGIYFIDRKHVVWSQGGREDTRYWIPTWDHPADKATWELYVTTDRGERALSNGVLAGSRRTPEGTEWHWSQTKPAPTYLISVVTGDYTVLQDVWRGIQVGYWTYPDSVEAAWRGFGQTPRMVDLFSTRTGVPYPWAKYDQAVAPDFIFGGMENVSATTQSDDRILHPDWAEPQANSESRVAHELAHQWFGNYVTARDWRDVWLHEGFASFFEAVWADFAHGEDAGSLARLDAQTEAIAADRNARRPLVYGRWAADPLELFLTGHAHAKGATVLQMLRQELGDSLFWTGIQAYARAHPLGSVATVDFQRDMERASGRDLSVFFQQWVYRAGLPVFQVGFSYDSVSRRLELTASQVQDQDSLTGLFEVDVDIEVMTDSGAVRSVVEVRGERASVTLALRAPPKAIRWDRNGSLLDVTDFPRPTVMLAHQLEHDDDLIGRIEAADLLRWRTDDPKAVLALVRALGRDTAVAVRVRAAAALGAFPSVYDESTPLRHAAGVDTLAVNALLLHAGRDRDPRVRQAVVTALGEHLAYLDSLPRGADTLGAPTISRGLIRVVLHERIDSDASGYVRGAALVAAARSTRDTGLRDILGRAERFAARESWADMDRVSGIRALGLIDSPAAREAIFPFLTPTFSRSARIAAIGALAARPRGREADARQALVPLLGDDDLFIRIAAVGALAAVGDASTIPALEARLAIESESRVINAITGAIARLRTRE